MKTTVLEDKLFKMLKDNLADLWQDDLISEAGKSLRNSNPCWKGYHPVGTKKKGGKTVPNCVPSESVAEVYTPSPAKPPRSPRGFNKQGTGLGNKLADLNRKEWEEKKKKEQGVAEGSLNELANTSLKVKEPKDFVNTNDRKQVTYKVMKFKSGKDTYLINFTVKGAPAFGKKSNWNAVNVAFGVKEKQDDYSFGDEMNTDLTAKNKNQFLIYSTVINAIRKFITEYNTEIDEIIMQGAGERQEAMYQRFFQSAGKYFPGWHHDGKHSLVRDVPRQKVKKVREQGVAEDWNKVNHHDHTNGLSQKAVNSYRHEHPGSHLQTAVTTKPSKLKAGSKAAKRRKSFCARMSGNKGPMKKPNGKPTPKALALRRWHCESLEELLVTARQHIYEAEGEPEGLKHLTPHLAKDILDQIETEGVHAIVKSIEWGDGGAKELVDIIKRELKKVAND